MFFSKNFLYMIKIFIMLILLTGSAWGRQVEYEGLIIPCDVIDIGTPTDGIVSKVSVDRSSLVQKGQILVEFEASVAMAAVEEAKEKAAFKGDIRLEQARLAFAKRVHERMRTLTAVSAQDKDKAATDIILAGLRIKKAREKHQLAQIEYKKAQAMLDRHFIKSPVSGVVVERYISPGEYVSTQPLMQIAQIDPLIVEVIVPADIFGMVRPGMTATVIPEFEEYGALDATVTIVDRVIDSASSTFGVRLELPNPAQEIPSGLKCKVRFEFDDASFERKMKARLASNIIK